jgi:O-antigen/teichoic acid export membrane protein
MTGVPIDVQEAVRPLPTHRAIADDALWLLASNIVYSGCQWAIVVLLAKIGAPQALGYFGLAAAVANPVVMLSGMALRSYQATDVLRRYAFTDFLNLRLAANVVAAAIIGSVAAAQSLPDAATAILVPLAIAKLAESTSEICYGLAQRHESMRFVAVSQAARAGIGLAALAGVVMAGGTLAAGTWALAAAWTAFLVAVDLPAAKTLEPVWGRPQAARLWSLFRECAPLGGLNGLVAVTQNVPRYLLQVTHGTAAVGYFTAVSAVGPLLGHLASALGHAAAPRLGWTAARDPRRYRALVVKLLGVTALVSAAFTLIASVFGRQILTIAYTEDYAAHVTSFAVLALAGGFSLMNIVGFFALVAARRLGLPLVIQGAGFVATAAMGLWAVPRFGVDGAAAALTAGMTAIAALNTWVLLRGKAP